MFLKELSILFLIAGFSTVYLAPLIVRKLALNEKVDCDHERELTEDELLKYKNDKAIINIKITGMLIALPGLVLLFIAFR